MIMLCNTLLPSSRAHSKSADIVKVFKLLLGIYEVIEVDLAPIIAIVSTDSKTVFRVLQFLYPFLIHGSFFSNTKPFLYCCYLSY